MIEVKPRLDHDGAIVTRDLSMDNAGGSAIETPHHVPYIRTRSVSSWWIKRICRRRPRG